jgi:hypothetical protein
VLVLAVECRNVQGLGGGMLESPRCYRSTAKLGEDVQWPVLQSSYRDPALRYRSITQVNDLLYRTIDVLRKLVFVCEPTPQTHGSQEEG